jgi:serine/threonine-protein kinase
MALVVQHAHARPVPPSSRTGHPVPGALDDLVLACLAKEPSERPQSARELLQRLSAIEGMSAWSEDRAREWWETHSPG